MVKTLVIMAGLPAAGKSHWAARMKRWLPSVYFDSDLWAKKYQTHIDFKNWSQKRINEARIASHKQKLATILDTFTQTDTIIVDTCFDVPQSRKMFYALEPRIRLLIIEHYCSTGEAKRRMMRYHDEGRMPGTQASRWNAYLHMAKHWKPINWSRRYQVNTGRPGFLVKRKLKAILRKEGLL